MWGRCMQLSACDPQNMPYSQTMCLHRSSNGSRQQLQVACQSAVEQEKDQQSSVSRVIWVNPRAYQMWYAQASMQTHVYLSCTLLFVDNSASSRGMWKRLRERKRLFRKISGRDYSRGRSHIPAKRKVA